MKLAGNSTDGPPGGAGGCVMGQSVAGQGRNIRCRCDNAAVVAILNSGSSKEELAMHLMRSLFFFLASFNISLYGEHISGVENGPADALSRDNHLSFLSQVRSAHQRPTRIQEELLQALVLNKPDWTSESGTFMLQNFLRRVWQTPSIDPTAVARTGS